MKTRIRAVGSAGVAGVLLLSASVALSAPTAVAAPGQESRGQGDSIASTKRPTQQPPSKPLPGCNEAGPNIGGIPRIAATLEGSQLILDWVAPKTRRGWEIQGYNIYVVNSSTGVMELRSVTSQTATTIEFEQFLDRADGPIPIQIAAYGWYKGDAVQAEEGCRAGEVINGTLKARNGQKITKRNWSKLSCLHLRDKAVIAVAGWYKGNARVVRPAAFGAAILLSSTYRPLAGPIGNWLYEDFVSAVRDWSAEVIGPAEDFRVTAISCFTDK